MTVEMEDRLRRTFETMMPLLVPDEADDGVLVGTPWVREVRAVPQRRLLVAACVAIAVAAAAVLVVVGRGRDSAPADTPLPATVASTSPGVVVPAGAPAWYGMIAPFLPVGFDHIALDLAVVSANGTRTIMYTAVNVETGQSLDLRLQSGPLQVGQTPPTGADPLGDLTETLTGVQLNATSGVQVTIDCGIGNVNGGLVNQTDFCAESWAKSARRSLAARLATEFPFERVDDVVVDSGFQYSDLEPISAAMSKVLTGQVQLGLGDGTTVQYGYPDLSAGTVATVLRHIYPDDDGNPLPAMHPYGTSSVGWSIRNGTAVRLFSSLIGGGQQVQLLTLIGTIQDIIDPDAAVSPAATTPSTAVTSTLPTAVGEQTHIVVPGDFLVGIAQTYCVTVDVIATANGWVDGLDHPLFPGNQIRIPAGGCAPALHRVPDVIGLDVDDAIEQLRQAGLTATITDDVNGQVTGTESQIVAAAEPAVGTVLSAGGVVHLDLTAGPPDPAVFGTTTKPLTIWPEVRSAESAGTTSEYGLQLCSSGPWTKYVSLTSPSTTEHRYQGTLCPAIDLDVARPDTTATCSSVSAPTTGYPYARCIQRTDATPTNTPGTSVDRTASADEQRDLDDLPGPSNPNAKPQFSESISAIDGDPSQGVTLTDDDANQSICYTIVLDTSTATGCFTRADISSGLLYGAFQDADGAITVVGIVPDDVATVAIAGQTITPNSNIWRTTVEAGTAFEILVQSADAQHSATTSN